MEMKTPGSQVSALSLVTALILFHLSCADGRQSENQLYETHALSAVLVEGCVFHLTVNSSHAEVTLPDRMQWHH